MPMRANDYTEAAVAAAKAVLLELTHLLQDYRDNIIVIGGWVPELLASGGLPPHVGSMDVDLALDHRKLQAAGYRTIKDLLDGRGYYQKGGQYPYKFFREVTVPGTAKSVEVEIDLLAGEYEGTGKSHKHQKIQEGLQPRKVRGCELAFDLPAREVPLEGTLPGGAKDTVTLRVASIVPFLAMKGIALEKRMKEKDAYDIVYCLTTYPGGYEAIAQEFLPHRRHGIVREGLGYIAKHFASTDSIGPVWHADFNDVTDPDEREIEIQGAYQRVTAFLEAVGIVANVEQGSLILGEEQP